jgi:hypothetical protein
MLLISQQILMGDGKLQYLESWQLYLIVYLRSPEVFTRLPLPEVLYTKSGNCSENCVCKYGLYPEK